MIKPFVKLTGGTYSFSAELQLPRPDVGFPGDSDGKEAAYNARDLGWIPGSGRSPKKGMDTHSSILTWRIPWTEEPGRPQSMGSQRVRHD